MNEHWVYKVPELWAAGLVLSCFGYTGELDAEIALVIIVTAASCISVRSILNS